MPDQTAAEATLTQTRRGRRPSSRPAASQVASQSPQNADLAVGVRLRQLRLERRFSLRALAEQSGLNANTLSLIENGKTSPSVSTLQRLANTLHVPMTAFFEQDQPRAQVIHQKAGQRQRARFDIVTLEDLSAGVPRRGEQALLVTLEAHADSGATPIVHTGLELVYCLEGCLLYQIEGNSYLLEPGDSLIFEAHLPHRWKNAGDVPSRSLLFLCPADESDQPSERHFKAE